MLLALIPFLRVLACQATGDINLFNLYPFSLGSVIFGILAVAYRLVFWGRVAPTTGKRAFSGSVSVVGAFYFGESSPQK
jgi:hypothetical protein